MAIWNLKADRGVIHHSEHGSQYTAPITAHVSACGTPAWCPPRFGRPRLPQLSGRGALRHRLSAVSMATTFSRWADACVPVWRTEEIRVDGQVLHVGDQAGRVGVSFFHLSSPGLWAVWATPWGCPRGVVRPAARPVS